MKDNQPNIDVPARKWENLGHILALLLFISLIFYIIFSFQSLPDQIPIHLNAKGEADNWGNKATILMWPLLAVPTMLLCYFLGRSPQVHNYPVKVTVENASQLYKQSRLMLALVNFEIMVMYFMFAWEFVYTAKGNPGLGVWMLVLEIGPLLLTVFYFLFRMRKLKPTPEGNLE